MPTTTPNDSLEVQVAVLKAHACEFRKTMDEVKADIAELSKDVKTLLMSRAHASGGFNTAHMLVTIALSVAAVFAGAHLPHL